MQEVFEGYFHHQVVPGVSINNAKHFRLKNYHQVMPSAEINNAKIFPSGSNLSRYIFR
jgi:hypothetical protein